MRPLVPRDLCALADTAAEMWLRDHLREAESLGLADGPGWTVCRDDVPVACGGFVPTGTGAALAWAVLAEMPQRDVLPVTRAARAGVAQSPYHWIEARVVAGFTASLRWVRLLGFVPVAGPRIIGPDGQELIRFSRARD